MVKNKEKVDREQGCEDAMGGGEMVLRVAPTNAQQSHV
jgi:hypothetical protein